MFNVAAIRSTGLSACLGLSQHVVGELEARGLKIQTAQNGGGSDVSDFPDDTPRPWRERLNALRGVGHA